MLKIGITGGIGSGKTLVCSIFNKLGIPVFNSDLEAKKLAHTHPEIKKQITAEFGEDIYSTNGTLDNKKLASIVFKNPYSLDKLNKIIHPFVRSEFMNWQNKHISSPYIIQEAAILFESGAYKFLDKTITVYSDIDTRIQRVIKRDNSTEDKVNRVIENQMNEHIKCEKADFILYNTEKKLLLPQILKLHNKFIN